MHKSNFEPATFVEALRFRAINQPDRLAYTFLLDGEGEEVNLTYGELDRRARNIARLLQSLGEGGKRALLLYPPGFDYIAAFFGCLYAGVVAVPVYPPRLNQSLLRFQAVIANAQATVALMTAPLLSRVKPIFDQIPELKNLRVFSTDTLPENLGNDWQEPDVTNENVALLQYTSGSTSSPKGVMLTHQNLIHNSALLSRAFEYTSESRGVSWLPVYHDMGLIGGILQPLYRGFPCVLMSPVSFLQRPFRWLDAISHYGATTSGGPNFAYDLCLHKVTAEQRSGLDLRSWSVAFNGAEPIRRETLERFAELFEPCGFRKEAFYPCYGLAEATLIVAGGPKASPPVVRKIQATALEHNRAVDAFEDTEAARLVVGCGPPMSGQKIVMVHPETLTECLPNEVGEIWVSGGSVAAGYWNSPEETADTFQAYVKDTGEGPFLRTGDLGFLQGQLFVTGRLKDVIIIRGLNHYPQDIELTVERSHSSVRPNCSAAFSVYLEDEERLVVVLEVERHHNTDFKDVIATVRQAVAENHELALYGVVLLKRGRIPKTSSGKIQRHLCRARFMANSLEVLTEWREAVAANIEESTFGSIAQPKSIETVEVRLALLLAKQLSVSSSLIDMSQPLTRYGLDSLGAIELIHRIEVDLNVVLPMESLLQGQSITQLAAEIRTRSVEPHFDSVPLIASAKQETLEHSLSRGQQALWFLHQAAPKSTAYSIANALRIRGDLDPHTMRGAFQGLVDRHSSLRTTFAASQGTPRQLVYARMDVSFTEEDASTWSNDALNDHLIEETLRPFDLEQGPLFRVNLFARSKGEHVLLLVVHHLVADFWSLGVLMHEISEVYSAERAKSTAVLTPLLLEYTDYVRWQEGILDSAEGENLWSYWKKQLAGELPTLNLPVDHVRPSVQAYRGKSHPFKLSAELTYSLKQLGQTHEATLYMTLLATFQLLLGRYANEEDILVGSPAACRNLAQLAGLVGYLANPLVMRGDLTGNPTFATFLERVRHAVLGAFAHQNYPFPLLVERLQPNRDLSMSPLLRAMFTFQKTKQFGEGDLAAFALGEGTARMKLGELELESLALEQQVVQFDLALVMAETDAGMVGSLQYNSDLFEDTTIKRMAGHFQTLLEGIVTDPKLRISHLQMLTAAEVRQLLLEWNETAREYPRDKCIHQLFEEQVERTTENIALLYADEQVTYRELNSRANQLAHYLKRMGVGAEVLVGLMMERSIEMVVGLLGILKAGGAYVPLDPEYPKERLSFMLEDAGVSVLLTQEHLRESLAVSEVREICLDRDWEVIARESRMNLAVESNAENLAYVIYTSGSTGKPKGTMLAHRGVNNCLLWMQDSLQLTEKDRVLLKASLSFDASVWELFLPLIVGAGVVVARPGGHQDGAYLVESIIKHEVTTVHSVPSMLPIILDQKRLNEVCSLTRVICGGEALPVETAKRFLSLSAATLHNFYGPTETSIGSIDWICDPHLIKRTVPIGRPIANTEVYILDDNLQPVPIGVPGELHIGSTGLARGYLHQPGLTADRFIPNPFSDKAGARLYRTGDLARHLPNGDIEFLDRIDQQVKLRGFRIELGEIETILGKHPAVLENVVVAREDLSGEKRLVAYVVSKKETPTVSELRRYLKEKLPEYMIPAAFVVLEEMPVTPGGKLDRRALPAVEGTRPELQVSYVAPRTMTEEIVAGIWAEVLRVERVGVADNFFELGGHSLLATQVISRVREALQIELALRSLFEEPTVEGLSGRIDEQLKSGAARSVAAIGPASRAEKLSLSYAQERLWFLDQLEPGNPFYNVPGVVRLRGRLNIGALEQSLNEVVKRHEALRTRFTEVAGTAVQVIAAAAAVSVPVLDISELGEQEREEERGRLAREEGRRAFDLSAGPLMRARLVRLGVEEHELLLTMHHIISDGWSVGVLVREVTALYEAFSQGQESPLAELGLQYADYAVWQREWLEGGELSEQLRYWGEQLAGAPGVLGLATDRPRPAVQSYRGGHYSFQLTSELTSGLRELSREADVTLFMTLLAGFQVLLYRYTGETDIVVGTPIANRNRTEIEGLIGFFVNTLVLRTDLSGEPSFRELLRRVREVALGAYAHQDMPFEKLVEELQPARDLGHSPLFQVMFVMQNAAPLALELPGLALTSMELHNRTAKCDLTLNLWESPQGLRGTCEYNTDLFDEGTIARLSGHFEQLLEAIAANVEQRISELPLLTGEEREQSLHRGEGVRVDYPKNLLLHQLFEEQVERAPENTALVFADEEVSYRELNRRANQLAHYLRGMGVGAEVRVGLMMERSIEMVVGLLGILKAGGAYVPLDPEYPRERLDYILEDAKLNVVLCERRFLEGLAGSEVRVVCLDHEREEIAAQGSENPSSTATLDNLIYVIYTSGSTGQPKGAMLSHRGIVNCLFWMQQTYQLNETDRFLHKTSLSFDPSVWELFWPLMTGAGVVITPPRAHQDSTALVQLIWTHQVTIIYLVPSMLGSFLSESGLEKAHALRKVICGGESLPLEIMGRFFSRLKAALHHSYGPTETSIAATEWVCERESRRPVAPIGRPLANTQIYLLDEKLQPGAEGLPHALYIGGEGLGRGYLNRADFTAERFIPHPFSNAPGARLYKTGDLARYLPDGNIEFLGRVDHQVKIRGFRIELEEIETVLKLHPFVREAAVIVREDAQNDKRLVAYLVANNEKETCGEKTQAVGLRSEQQLRRYLKEKLPEYMIPAAFVVLEEMPVTPGGKLDRRALPAVEGTRPELQVSYVAPRTMTEEIVAGIWAEVLRVERVGVADNFFELGGHSLLATQVISRVREALQIELALRSLFEEPTVEGLSGRIDEQLKSGAARSVAAIGPASCAEKLSLSYAQERLWFLDQLEPGNPFYNVPGVVRLRGRLNIGALEQSLNEVVKRHEALRTRFTEVAGTAVQVIAAAAAVSVPVLDISELGEQEREEERGRLAREEGRRAFDLSAGPLMRARLVRLGVEEHELLLTMHHIISDGWSVGVLVREVTALYEAFSQGQESPLAELGLQYADYAVWQREWLEGGELSEQLRYWGEQLAGAPGVLGLATDRPRPAVQSYRGGHYSFQLTSELTSGLRELSREADVTLFMTLLAGFQVLLYRYTGETDIVVGTPIANRNRAEIEGLIGFFVNTLVLRTDLSGEPSFRELLRRVREVALGAYAHQDMPFEKLVEELQPARDLGHSPLFQVMFVMQNAAPVTLELGGLSVRAETAEGATAKFDLTLMLTESTQGLDGVLTYNTDLFDEMTIARLSGHFKQLLEAITVDAGQRITELRLLTAAEEDQVLVAWNERAREYPDDKCIHQLFEEQVERTPENVALMFAGERVTYRVLNHRANQLANYLQELGIGPEITVGICLERSIEMVVALLAVLKAGGAYVPLDPEYPQERLSFMLKDAEVKVLLTKQQHVAIVSEASPHVVRLDTERGRIAQESENRVSSRVRSENLAYVIYTSGSTGKPKGVAMKHNSLANLIYWQCRHPVLSKGQRRVQFASLSFDASFREIFSTLCSGGTLLLISEELRQDTGALARFIAEQEVEKILVPFAVLERLADEITRLPKLPHALREVITAGEQVRITKSIEHLFSELKECRLHNHYGPTETHVATALMLEGSPDGWANFPSIGRPIPGRQIYILDRQREVIPVGVVGEIYIGGAGVARGYLNRPDLTAERFVPHPCSSEPGARLYRTGDLARYLPDGNIEFLGRIDHQVKVRGYRIELGEVEAVLGAHAAVSEVVILAREDAPNEKRLVAYVVLHPEQTVTVSELRDFLKKKLPDHMIPAAYVLLNELPLTANRKLDRQALPVPEPGRPQIEQAFVPPRTAAELVMARIWGDLLNVEHIGIHDNFFELGGHSLLATQVISQVRSTFQVEIPLRRLFERPTVAGLLDEVASAWGGMAIVEEVAGTVGLIEELSDEEASEMLAEQS